MSEDVKNKTLPGDHGQFGVDNATEEFARLKDKAKPTPEPSETGESVKKGEA